MRGTYKLPHLSEMLSNEISSVVSLLSWLIQARLNNSYIKRRNLGNDRQTASRMLLQYVFAAVLVAQGCLAMNERITDGENATPHQFPYQVSIVWGVPPLIGYRHVCGGSILNEKWVLTAGHCVTELPKIGRMGVYVGKHVINQQELGQQFSEVGLKIVHYNYPGGVAQHDIALLSLKTRLIFNDKVGPVKLPASGKIHTGEVTISGWGSISKKVIPVLPTVLQKAHVPVVDTQTCLEAFREVPGDAQVYDTHVCTGPLGGSVSACSGDSGGPVVQYDEEGAPEQVGIVSWGSYPCGVSGMPTVHTRVSAYVEWIQQKLAVSS